MSNRLGDFFLLMKPGQIITTSADVTLNGGLIRELPQNPLNSGLGIILICPDETRFLFGLPQLCLSWLNKHSHWFKRGGLGMAINLRVSRDLFC